MKNALWIGITGAHVSDLDDDEKLWSSERVNAAVFHIPYTYRKQRRPRQQPRPPSGSWTGRPRKLWMGTRPRSRWCRRRRPRRTTRPRWRLDKGARPTLVLTSWPLDLSTASSSLSFSLCCRHCPRFNIGSVYPLSVCEDHPRPVRGRHVSISCQERSPGSVQYQWQDRHTHKHIPPATRHQLLSECYHLHP